MSDPMEPNEDLEVPPEREVGEESEVAVEDAAVAATAEDPEPPAADAEAAAAAAEDVAIDEAAIDEAAVESPAVEDGAVEEVAGEDAPAGEVPTEEAPAEEAPAEVAASGVAPSDETAEDSAAAGASPEDEARRAEERADESAAETSARHQELEAVVEAILFAATEPVPRPKLLEVFDPADRDAATSALERVKVRYAAEPWRGIVVEEVAGGLRLVTRPELHGYLRRFFEASGANKLSMAALETLAIVAYRQPITGPEIQELRGVGSSGVLKTLLERRLVRIAGRKEVVGKPFLYATTREFLMHFGLAGLRDLPPLEELEETLGEGAGAALPEVPPVGGTTLPDREEQFARDAAEIAEREDG